MDLVEIKQELDKTAKRLADFRGLFDLDTKQARIDELDETMADPNFGMTSRQLRLLLMKPMV